MAAYLNLAFPNIANLVVNKYMDANQGKLSSDLFSTFLYSLPENNIAIPSSVYADLEVPNGAPLKIENSRAFGYFKGDVQGMKSGIWKGALEDGNLKVETSQKLLEVQIS